MSKPNVGIVVRKSLRERILSDWDLETLESFANVTINDEDRDIVDGEAAEFLKGMDGAMTSWNSGDLTPAILEGVPTLKIWAYGAGTVKGKICDEAWEKDIVVTSAAPAIADDVAEMTLGFMTMGLRRVFSHSRAMREGEKKTGQDRISLAISAHSWRHQRQSGRATRDAVVVPLSDAHIALRPLCNARAG